MCKKLVSFIMSKISEAKPACNHFVIYNASETANGIPACRCYVKSGIASGFKVHEGGLNEMTLDKCIGNLKGMPVIYFYVKNPNKGGKKKNRKKTLKAKKKKKKTRKKNKKV